MGEITPRIGVPRITRYGRAVPYVQVLCLMRQGCGQATPKSYTMSPISLDADGQADKIVAHAVFIAVRLRIGCLHP